jgi:hypothetical protein
LFRVSRTKGPPLSSASASLAATITSDDGRLGRAATGGVIEIAVRIVQ